MSKVDQNDKNFDDKFKLISDEDFIKYTKKNYINMLNFFDKHPELNNKYIHISLDELSKDDIKDASGFYSNSVMYKNPSGLWFGFGRNWIDEIKNFGDTNKWLRSTYIYEVVPNNILEIKGIKEFKKFIDKYKNPDKKLKVYNVINWSKLHKDYNGISIYPFLGDELLGNNCKMIGVTTLGMPGTEDDIRDAYQSFYENLLGKNWKKNYGALSEWYRFWDIPSGVIWNRNGVKELKLIKKLDTFKELM